ncbi:MAG: 50S ribosomal protein L24 [Candidatus Dojkabacteria bacterium]|nr:50S ribosomal protein L24 [Candidatus Dojkabacteria bacterium]
MAAKIKKGDTVKVMSGAYKGKIGIVNRIDRKNSLVYIDGINVKKRAVKKGEHSNENFVYVVHPIHYSNVKKIEPLSDMRDSQSSLGDSDSATSETK